MSTSVETAAGSLPEVASERLWEGENDVRFQVRDIVAAGLPDEFERVGFDASYRAAAQRKFAHHVVKASGLSAPAANILKQTCLSLGAEAAVHKHAIDCKIDSNNAPLLISATSTQLDRVLQKCLPQPFALPKMAAAIQRQRARQKYLAGQHPLQLMAILNLTPDSFSDGGQHAALDKTIETVAQWVELGIDWLDIGGESTRPGAIAIDAEEEQARVIPVIAALVNAFPRLKMSIDTRNASTASAALSQGVAMVNDVSGLTWDANMLSVVADAQCPVVIMHSHGTPETMQDAPEYPNDDVVGAVAEFWYRSVARAVDAGVALDNLILDPGFGFGKTVAHNRTLLARLSELTSIGFPVLVGLSRKRFLDAQGGLAPDERDYLTVAATTQAFDAGARYFRVHNVNAFAPVFRWLSEQSTERLLQ